MASLDNRYTSWADQWDPNPEYAGGPAVSKKKSGNGNSSSSSYGKKVGEGLGKTKDVASTGFKKVKQGTSVSFNWIKDKYQKRTTTSTSTSTNHY